MKRFSIIKNINFQNLFRSPGKYNENREVLSSDLYQPCWFFFFLSTCDTHIQGRLLSRDTVAGSTKNQLPPPILLHFSGFETSFHDCRLADSAETTN